MDIQTQVNTFVADFMKKYSSLIGSVGRKYLIPNRYDIDDIKQYIAERIIHILTNRLSSNDNQIEDPEKYFKTCITWYCVEYQRMRGYIADLPKRPRKNCELDEHHFRSYGFKYLDDISTNEYNSLYTEDKIEEEMPDDKVWETLMSILTRDEINVILCIYKKNMTWLETSKYLDVPQSTCWIRKDRALDKIYKQFEKINKGNNELIRKFLRGEPRVLSDFSK